MKCIYQFKKEIMKINFRKFPMYANIRKDMVVERDIAEEYADSIYRNIPGISAHVLAEKIFRSTGETELDDTEVDTILSSIDLFPGVFADSMKDYIGKHKQIPPCRKG